MIKMYGVPRSSAGRCYFMLEELGLPFEIMPLDMRAKEHKSEAFLKLNPNGKVPVMVDGDVVVWESIAINHYLADKYRPELLGRSPAERAHQVQWSTWAMVDLQPPLVDILIQMVFTPEEKRSLTVIEKAREKVYPMLAILDRALENKSYILGAHLSVADFNLATVVNIASSFSFDLTPYKNLTPWLARLQQRPAYQKITQMRAEASL